MSKLRLGFRKQLIEELSTRFDTVYEQLTQREESLFEDEKTRRDFTEKVTFSSAAMSIGCGAVRLIHSRCDFFDELLTTREYADCALLGAKDYSITLPRCHRTWMLKTSPAPACPGGAQECTVCSLISARHAAAEQKLLSEVASGATRYVALKVLIHAANTSRRWDAFERGEFFVESCKQLPIKHACALLIDATDKVVWLCESEQLLPQVRLKVNELAGMLAMRADVHPLCRQWQSTPKGRLSHLWCMLYSQAMALALVRATSQTSEDAYLDTVLQLIHGYMRDHMLQ